MRSFIVALLAAWLPGIGLAQTGGVSGTVVNRATGRPVIGAEVTLLDESRSTRTDSLGRYAFVHVTPGVVRMRVRAIGFPSEVMVFDLAERQFAERPIILSALPQELPSVNVQSVAPTTDYRMVGFERRRQTGRGQYLTENDLAQLGASDVANALKGLRGVTFECGNVPNGNVFGRGGCFVRMSRAPMRCVPEYVVDDMSRNDFGPLTPIADIIGIEVYTGPGDVAGEFSGRNAGCGVIVIWTRSGPIRRKP